jgi:sugar phosphate isomerase/epimerase
LRILGLRTGRAASGPYSVVNGVAIGVQTYSFRSLKGQDVLEPIIQTMVNLGIGECELFYGHLIPGTLQTVASLRDNAPPNLGNDELERRIAALRIENQKKHIGITIRQVMQIRDRFRNAGIDIHAYNASFGESEREIEYEFDIAQALDAKFITWSGTLSQARKVAPIAEKRKIVVAMHGHDRIDDPNEFATPASFAKAMEMSSYFGVNLDIGHFTAAGFDAVAYIRQHHDRITNLHLKDRKRNRGANVPWGEGDTPIREVLQLLKKERYPIQAYIEYEHAGTGSSPDEVKKCLTYVKAALA